MAAGLGVQNFFNGLSLVFKPHVRPFVIVPALVSLAVIIAGLWLGFSYINDLSNYLVEHLPGWLSFLEWLLIPLLYLAGILIGAWLFGLLAAIAGSPFLGELSMRVDPPSNPPNRAWWQEIVPALSRELRKLLYHLPRLVLLLVVSFIPVINVISPILWLGFGAWMMAVQFCDYSTENRGADFRSTLAKLKQHRASALGFGLCTTVAMSIPLLNFLVAPVAVVGGTLLMRDLYARSA